MPASRPPKLTVHERRVIDAMRARLGHLAASATFIAHHTGQTYQGAGMVLASCTRKGLVSRVADKGDAAFRLTEKGWRLARPAAAQQQ